MVRDAEASTVASKRKRPGQCYAPGCVRDGARWVGVLFLCAEHAERWPKTWGDLHRSPVAT